MTQRRYCPRQTDGVTDAGRTDARSLRIISWNVHGSARPSRNGLARAIRSFDPDIIALQEIRIGQAHRLANRLGWNVQWTRKHLPFGPMVWWRAEGLAVISRLRITPLETWVLTPGVGHSTYRRRVAQRVAVHLDSAPDVAPLEVINTHLASHDDGREERRVQATLLASLIGAHCIDTDPGTRILMAGDLNAHDEPGVLAPLHNVGLLDAWEHAVERLGGSGSTSPSRQPSARIDYVLTGPGFRPYRAEVPGADAEWIALSDHLPVVVDVTLG